MDDITRSGAWIQSILPPFHKSDMNWESNPCVQVLLGGWVGTEPWEGNYPSLRRCPLPTKKAELCWESLGMVCGWTGFWPYKDYIRCVPFRLRSHAHSHPAAATRTAQAECQHLQQTPGSPASRIVRQWGRPARRLLWFELHLSLGLAPVLSSSCSVSYRINTPHRRWTVALCAMAWEAAS